MKYERFEQPIEHSSVTRIMGRIDLGFMEVICHGDDDIDALRRQLREAMMYILDEAITVDVRPPHVATGLSVSDTIWHPHQDCGGEPDYLYVWSNTKPTPIWEIIDPEYLAREKCERRQWVIENWEQDDEQDDEMVERDYSQLRRIPPHPRGSVVEIDNQRALHAGPPGNHMMRWFCRKALDSQIRPYRTSTVKENEQ